MSSDPHATQSPSEALAHAIEHARHVLPAQGPIGEFIHHNTLHAYQHLPFDEALRRASMECDAEVYWPEAKFRTWLAGGYFGPANIETALDARYAKEVLDEPIGPITRRTIERLMLLHDVVFADLGEIEAGEADPSLLGLYHVARTLLANEVIAAPTPSNAPVRTHRDLVVDLDGTDPATLVDPVFVRFLGAYLDDGMSRWAMPERESGLLPCLRAFLASGTGMLPAFQRRALARFERPGADATSLALEALAELGVDAAEFDSYVPRVMLELPGWCGMSALLSGTVTSARALPPGVFDDLVAARLVLGLEALRDVVAELGFRGTLAEFPAHATRTIAARTPPLSRRIAVLFEIARLSAISKDALLRLGPSFACRVVSAVEAFDSMARRKAFLAAMEDGHLHAVVSAVASNRERPAQSESPTPRFQVMFCFDDREEGIRRHFEEFDPRHVTFGVAGFFGIAMSFESFDDPNRKDFCPIIVTPGHSVVERAHPEAGPQAERRKQLRRVTAQMELEVADASRSFLRGLFVTPILGLLSVIPLSMRIFFPHVADRVARTIRHWMIPDVPTRLDLEREVDPEIDDEDAKREAGKLFEGFTLDERADRVAGTLENIGMVKRFARIVTALGHGASTVNNPHHSAYDCGACGGRSGGQNARAFAMMANDPAVRERLAARGIVIPKDTWFIGGLHDTTTDGIALFDLDRVPEALTSELAALRQALDAARARSAHERCRRFEHAPKHIGVKQALRHVEERSVDLSQARPELGHATIAACIVGRRAISRGLFLDRRAFLISYDPNNDPDSKILERILTPAVPVGSGINLEYYFSSVDPDRWGCGTKLPHNLSGLIGVMEGSTGDLRTGLPREMIEVHEPVRLLCIIDAPTSAILTVAERVPVVREIVVNQWLRLVSIDPETGVTEVFTEHGFQPIDLRSDVKLPVVKSAADWYRGHIESLAPARIAPDASLANS